MEFALNGADTTPVALVMSVMIWVALENTALAPVGGAVSVTLTPLIGFPSVSAMVTASGFVNCALTSAVCGVDPAVAFMSAAGPATTVAI